MLPAHIQLQGRDSIMAKRKALSTGGSNGSDVAEAAKYLKRINPIDDELAAMRADYMNACKGPRASLKNVMAEVREAGLSMPAFRETLTLHRQDRAAQKRADALEADDREALERMVQALGEYADTPLGQAAMERAQSHEEALYSLHTNS
jgi:uncharacterized protein (UPF0335 family)